ncbi:MAG: hypothetical protein ACU841_08400 [Gammaproteobacteria bacterium]
MGCFGPDSIKNRAKFWDIYFNIAHSCVFSVQKDAVIARQNGYEKFVHFWRIIMKLRKWVVLVLFSTLATPGFAYDHKGESDGYDVMMDLILRPVGLAGTLIGAGVFVGVSPLTALASIPSPHDAFEKLGDTLVCKPFKYTFYRKVGDYRYDEGCARPDQPPAPQPVVRAEPKPVISEPAPEYQPPSDTNKKIDAIFKREMMK